MDRGFSFPVLGLLLKNPGDIYLYSEVYTQGTFPIFSGNRQQTRFLYMLQGYLLKKLI